MKTIKRIFLSLSLAFLAIVVPLHAMKDNAEQLTVTQSTVRSLWNTISAVKNASLYSVNMVAAEARYLPEVVNEALMHMIAHDEEPLKEQNTKESESQNNLKNGNSMAYDVYILLSTMKNRVVDGVNYTHDLVIGGAHYTHDVINGTLKHIAADGE